MLQSIRSFAKHELTFFWDWNYFRLVFLSVHNFESFFSFFQIDSRFYVFHAEIMSRKRDRGEWEFTLSDSVEVGIFQFEIVIVSIVNYRGNALREKNMIDVSLIDVPDDQPDARMIYRDRLTLSQAIRVLLDESMLVAYVYRMDNCIQTRNHRWKSKRFIY